MDHALLHSQPDRSARQDWLERCQTWLVNPSAAIKDPGQRRQARLLSSMLLALFFGNLCFSFIPHILHLSHLDRSFYVQITSLEALGFLYLLSRSRYYSVAASLTIAVTSATAFALSVPSSNKETVNLIAYLVTPVLLGGIFLRTQATLLLIALQIAGVLGFQELYHVSFPQGEVELMLAVSLLMVLANRHWTLVERDRQAALASKYSLLSDVIEHMPDAVYVKDSGGHYVLRNASVARLLGIHAAENLISKTDSVEIDGMRLINEQTVMQTGQPLLNCEELVLDGEGKAHWLLTTFVPMKGNQSEVIGVISIGRDVSERKQAEEALTRYNQRLDLLHRMDQGVQGHLSAQEIAAAAVQNLYPLLPCNCACVMLTGEHPVLASWHNSMLQLPVGWEKMPLDVLLGHGIHTCLTIPLTTKDQVLGELKLGAAVSFTDENREIADEISNQLAVALQSTFLREQLQQHMAELEIRVEERTVELERATRRVEAILNNTNEAIILASCDQTISITNPAFDQMFGYTDDALFHQPLTTLLHPSALESFEQAWIDMLNRGETKQIEVMMVRAEGTTFFAEFTFAPIKEGSKSHRRSVVCSLRDVTVRKRTEEGLRSALEQERELGELKTRFITMVSHEFRTPLATISSSADLLQQYIHKMELAQRDSHFEKIHTSVHYMIELLENVLFLGKTEDERLAVELTPLNLDVICREVLEEAQSGSGPEIIYSCTGAAEVVLLDQHLIQHILANLLSNAIKYSMGGVIRFDVVCEDRQTIIRVSDQGIGIPSKELVHLGKQFYRAQNVSTIRGTGLGIAIIREAVNLLQGTMTIDSEEGVGTTVTIILPTARREIM